MKPQKLDIQTGCRQELVDITSAVRSFLKALKARSGAVVIFTPHTTAGVTINENADPDVQRDILRFMAKMIPADADFTHGEGNSDAHIKSSLFSPSLTVMVQDGELMLGTWQGIYFAEFDGPRQRQVWLKFMPDGD